jgi:hypothetical protein
LYKYWWLRSPGNNDNNAANVNNNGNVNYNGNNVNNNEGVRPALPYRLKCVEGSARLRIRTKEFCSFLPEDTDTRDLCRESEI